MPQTDLIEWGDWGAEVFARATEHQKPVLLFLGPAWCRWSAHMRRVGFADPRVTALVQQHFIPVLVDADHRPDISDRYTLDGWPTTAFLTPSGELLGGSPYLEPDTLVDVLENVARAFETRRAEIDERVTRLRRSGPHPPRRAVGLDAGARDWFRTQLLERVDPEWGGFGSGAKRAETDALAAAVSWPGTGTNTAVMTVATQTLDVISSRGLWDGVDGGFFRACMERDWSKPEPEKLLSVNAGLLAVFLTASVRFEREDYAERARDIIRYTHGVLADPDGGFFTSERVEGEEGTVSPGRSPEERRSTVDKTVYTDATAVMVSSYVLAAQVLGDESLLQFAAESVDRLMRTYEPAGGVGHVASAVTTPRGLLRDQVMVSLALLDLYDATGQAVYLDVPRELMAYCRRTMWHPSRGFADRDPGLSGDDAAVGLLSQPVYPLETNCRAAIVLARLAELAEAPHDRTLAEATLVTQTPVYRERGLDGAIYVMAVDAVS
ncbi:MAG: DUF255 domain-containing protein [Acidobacteriota bacterium]|nr:DUF255 domain-containing protein [Acidobacteriota bacterium]